MIYCHDCKFRIASNLRSEVSYCAYYNSPNETILGCESGESKITTNADCIRAMSDEELADEILRWFNWLNAVDWDDNRIIEWLKQPYNEKGENE